MENSIISTLNTTSELKEIFDTVKEVRLYGAGYYLKLVLQGLDCLDKSYRKKIKCIMVKDTKGNPLSVENIPIVAFQDEKLSFGDYVLLTLGNRFMDEVYGLLKDTGAHIFRINFHMFQEKPYGEVEEMLSPFLERFPRGLTEFNKPISEKEGKRAWTCWWQGEDHAPEIVKACWKSQKRYLPDGVEHIILSKENYKDYITLPSYIMEKVQNGDITLATLSDIIRASLLYKYGGFWMDSTLFLLKPLEEEILDFSIYTRNLPETQYCTKVMWADWFLYAKPGNQLFQFLMEGFFFYFSLYEKIPYYFMVDYIIAIACNNFPDVEAQLKKIPFNNEKAMELGKHLTEIYDEVKFKDYIQGTAIQKLTYKVDYKENTILEYLLNLG